MHADDLALVRRDGTVGVVTMNHPQRRNVYSVPMKQALLDQVVALMDDSVCRVIVLTGAGGNFSAGGDISEMRDREAVEMREYMRKSHQLVELITRGPKPVVAAVEGYAYGAGMSLACVCDFLVASTTAKFCAAFIRIGLLPDMGLRWTLAQRVGPAKARELIALAEEIEGAEAARIGLVNRLTEPGEALPAAIALAGRLAKRSPTALALLKASFAHECSTLDDALRMEIDYQLVVKQTQDHKEAVKAFLEKRGGRS